MFITKSDASSNQLDCKSLLTHISGNEGVYKCQCGCKNFSHWIQVSTIALLINIFEDFNSHRRRFAPTQSRLFPHSYLS